MVLLLVIVLMLPVCVSAKNKKITGTRIKTIYQDIGGKRQIVGCNHKKCAIHKSKRYGSKTCATGSDLLQIRVKKGKNYKSLKSLKYGSLQGGGIDGDSLFILFSKKPNNKGKNKTAIVEIDIEEKKVVDVVETHGITDIKFVQLGHANDFAKGKKYYHVPWYQTNGKQTYSNRAGYIGTNLDKDATSKVVKKNKKGRKSAIFGAAKISDCLAFGFRETKNGKNKKRYVAKYVFKNEKYKYKKKLFSINKNSKYPITQCMEYSKHSKMFYLIRYNKKGKGDNNCIEVINKKGKVKKKIIIKDPNNIRVSKSGGKKSYKINTKSMKWEVECICHHTGNEFFYTQYRPKRGKKQAYLYYATIK